MEKMIIHVPEEMVNYIEGLQYDLEGLKDLITRISTLNVNDAENETDLNSFWLQKYLDKNLEYRYAKQELEKDFIKPMLSNIKNYSWNLDFNSCEVTIEYED